MKWNPNKVLKLELQLTEMQQLSTISFLFFSQFLLHIISGRTSCEYSLAPNVILVLETIFFFLLRHHR